MNKTLSNIMIFAAGSAIGSIATWKIVEEKYKRIAQEEIDSVKEVFSRRYEEQEKTEEPEPPTEEEYQDYVDLVKNTNYGAGSECYIDEKGEPIAMDEPYVISPEEFDEKGYDVSSLRYYSDGVLVDEAGDIVDDVDSVVGSDSLTRFGEYEPDSVFVRDDRLEIDYEILLDARSYAESVKKE